MLIAQTIIDIFTQLSNLVGLDISSLMTMSATITVVVNYLKVTSPFSKVVKGSVIPIVIIVLSLIISVVTLWGAVIKIIVSTVIISVLSIGGWATTKILAEKISIPSGQK